MCERRTPEDHSPQHAALLQHALSYQAGIRALEDEPDAIIRSALRAQIRHDAERIVGDLEPDLITIAQAFMRRSTARALLATRAQLDTYQEVRRSMALSLAFHILDQLPRLTLDPARDPRPLLLAVARRKQISEERRMEGRSWPRGDQGPAEVSLQAEFFTDAGEPITHEPEDPAAEGAFAEVEARLDGGALADRVRAFSERWLSPEDQRVVAARLGQSPPAPFAEIAAQLGPGWSEATVRQRYRRALKRIREHLEGGL